MFRGSAEGSGSLIEEILLLVRATLCSWFQALSWHAADVALAQKALVATQQPTQKQISH